MSKRLFAPVNTEKAEADLNLAQVGGGNSDGHAYISSYLDGARSLVDRALKTGDGSRLIYSALFQYRHAIELALKELIFSTQTHDSLWSQLAPEHPLSGKTCEELGRELERTHSLEKLMQWVLALPPQVAGAAPSEFRAIVVELHNLDPNGETFRYARPRAQPMEQVFRDLRVLDLKRIRDGLEQAIDWLLMAQLRLVVESRVADDPYSGEYWRREDDDDDGESDADDFGAYSDVDDGPAPPEPGEVSEERWHVDELKGEIAIAERSDGTKVELPRFLLASDVKVRDELRVRVGLSKDSRVWKAELASLTSIRWFDYIDYEEGSYQPKVRPPEDW